DKQGKMRIHIHGHSNQQDPPTDDSELHWAHTLMPNSPSINGIGKTSHYLPGSTIIGFWLDPLTRQIPFILGSKHKAGITQGGSSDIEPSGAIDNTYRSPPGGPKGQALDPNVLANVTKITEQMLWSKSTFDWGYSQVGSQQNQGALGSQNNAQKIAKGVKQQNNPQFIQPSNPTVASAGPMNILLAIQSIDSNNTSGPIPKSLNAMITLNQLASMTSPGGVASAAAGALGSALQQVAGALGTSNALGAASAMSQNVSNSTVSSVINQAVTALLTNSGAGVLSDGSVQEVNNLVSAFASINNAGPTSVSSGGSLASMIAGAASGSSFNINVQANGATINQTITINQNGPTQGQTPTYAGNEQLTIATAMAGQTANVITSSIQSGNTSQLIGLVESLIDSILAQAQQATTGANTSNILSQIGKTLPNVASTITNMVGQLVNTMNNAGAIQTLQQDASMALSIAQIAWNTSNMFQGTEAEQAAGVAAAAVQSVAGQAVGALQTV